MKKICLLLVGLCLSAGVFAAEEPRNGDLDLARRLESAFTKVAEQASRSVVVITCTHKHPPKPGMTDNNEEDPPAGPPETLDSAGSGVILRADGFILTNQHVVDDAEKIKVRLQNGSEYEAKIIGTDEVTDIAVIKIEAKDLPVARLGDSDKSRVGQWAIAIGAPYELEYSVTIGFISAKGRNAVITHGGSAYEDYIQTDAAINPGNSGGPLCDIEGRVVGINTLIAGLSKGIGFAIPINMARDIAAQLIAHGKITRPWLGVSIEPLDDNKELQELAGRKDGVVVKEVRPGTPAAASQLKPADIIISVDGVAVKSPRELQQQILAKKIGEKVSLEIVRSAETLKVEIETAEMKLETVVATAKPPGKFGTESAWGLTVQTITKEIAKELGLEEGEGVVVTAVDEDSVAARKGFRRGDLILEVERHPVRNATDFKRAITKADAEKGVLLYLKRGANFTFAVLKPK